MATACGFYWTTIVPFMSGSRWLWYPQLPVFVKVNEYESPGKSGFFASKPGYS